MRMWCFVLIGLVFPIFAVSANAEESQPSQLRFEISFPKNIFEVGEQIPYQLTVTNVSGQPIEFLWGTTNYPVRVREYSIQISDLSGKKVRMVSPFVDWDGCVPGIKLEGGESAAAGDLLNRWGVLDRPGDYKVNVRARPRSNAPPGWEEVASATITLVTSTDESRESRFKGGLQKLHDAVREQEKLAALQVLSSTLDPRAIPEIVATLRYVQPYCAEEVLFPFETEKALPDAIVNELLRGGPDDRVTSVLRHYHLDGKTTIPKMKPWLTQNDPQKRATALSVLSMIQDYHDDTLKPIVSGALFDSDRNVRHNALLVISSWRYAAALKDVMKVAKADPDESLRAQATELLGWYGDKSAIPLLKELMHNPNSKIAHNAARALDQITRKKSGAKK